MSQLYGALTATYRDRVNFAFVSDDSPVSNQVKLFYSVETPAIVLESEAGVTVYDGAMKLPQLVKWLEPFALTAKASDKSKDQAKYLKNQLQSIVTVDTYKDFSSKVLADESAALVYFSLADKKPHINHMLKFAEEHGEYVNCVWYQVSNIDELKQNFRSASYLPQFRSF